MRRAAALAVAVATLAAFAAALAIATGSPAAPAPSAVAIRLDAALTPAGQRVVTGSIPSLADHVRVTSDGTTRVEPVDPSGVVTAGRRHVVIPIQGIGPWRVDVLWGEHRLGSAGGGSTPPGRV